MAQCGASMHHPRGHAGSSAETATLAGGRRGRTLRCGGQASGREPETRSSHSRSDHSRGSALPDIVESIGPIFVVSAAVFGPLSGWLAGRRDRHPVVWLAFGALLGPLAVLLITAAPPGRCAMCDTPVRGWASICPTCGAPLTIAAGAGRSQARRRAPSPTVELAFEPEMQPSYASAAVGIRPKPVLTMLASDASEDRATSDATPPPIRLPVDRSATARGRRPEMADRGTASGPREAYGQHQEPVAEVLATAVYFGGTAGLTVGGRYVVSRHGPLFRLFGPVDLDPTRVALERPLARLSAVAVGERLVITEGNDARVSLAIGMGSLAGMDAAELELALSRPEASAEDRRPASG